MAKTTTSTKQKTDVEEVKTTTKKPSAVEKENELLKEQIAQMQAQIELLAKQISVKEATPKEVTTSAKQDKNIKIINMTLGTLVLRGTQIWKIDGQFNSRVFSEREARVIVANMNKCARSGKFYIPDEEFVKENELDDSYQNMLSDNELKKLFDKDSNAVIDAYNLVADGQKKIIIDMVMDKKFNGEEVDGNILSKLGKLSGKDLVGIEPLEDE